MWEIIGMRDDGHSTVLYSGPDFMGAKLTWDTYVAGSDYLTSQFDEVVLFDPQDDVYDMID